MTKTIISSCYYGYHDNPSNGQWVGEELGSKLASIPSQSTWRLDVTYSFHKELYQWQKISMCALFFKFKKKIQGTVCIPLLLGHSLWTLESSRPIGWLAAVMQRFPHPSESFPSGHRNITAPLFSPSHPSFPLSVISAPIEKRLELLFLIFKPCLFPH